MYVAFALLADAANVSQDGKLNVLGVFDTVRAATLPAVHARAMLVVRFKALVGDAGTHRLGIAFTAPGGAVVWRSDGQMTIGALPPGAPHADVPFAAALDLPLQEPGAHTLTVAVDDVVMAQLPVYVHADAMPTPFVHPPAGALLS